MIGKIAEKIHEYKLDVSAILMIETFKPLSFIGANMGRALVSPFLPAFGDSINMNGEKVIQIFEKRENLEKLIIAVEKLSQEEKEKNESERALEEPKKKGWRRFLPF